MALTNDDLLAISQLLDMKLKPIKEDQKQIHDEIHNMKLVLASHIFF